MIKYFKDHPYLLLLINAFILFLGIFLINTCNRKPKNYDAYELKNSKSEKNNISFEDLGKISIGPLGFNKKKENVFANLEITSSEPKTFIDSKLSHSLDTLRIRIMKHYKRPVPDSLYSESDSVDKALSINLSQTQILHVLKLTKDSLKKELIIAKEKMAIDTILYNLNIYKQPIYEKPKPPKFSYERYLKENAVSIILFFIGLFTMLLGIILSFKAKRSYIK